MVAAVDPSPPFVAAVAERCPGVEVHRAPAESIPFDDATFDAALAQLVVHFMADPVAGLREMARVTRAGGTVAACVWDHDGGGAPLATFWRAALALDPAARDEGDLAGASEGDLARLAREAGLEDVEDGRLSVTVEHASFEDWWEPYTLGVGPAGDHVASLDGAGRAALREQCRALLPPAPFTVEAAAWVVRGVVAG
jgi:ubiquinone/menaquinone biosynthesis C-methylase UbiE